jgi:type I restriction enzyme S subunit
MIKASLTAELARHTAWPLDRIKDHSSKIGSGITPTGGAASYLNAGVPLLRSQNVHFSGLRLDDVAFIGEDTHEEMAGTQLKAGDVLLNITGASIGRCTFIPEGFGEANVNQHVCIIRPSANLDHRFLTYCLAAPWGQDQILSSFTGASRQGLGQRDLGEIQIPLPRRPEQERIVAYLDVSCAAIDAAMAAKRRQIETLDALLKTTLHTAVTRGLDETAELRESGYEWLGKTPVKWKLIAIKRIVSTKITDGPHDTPDLVDDGAQFISAEAIKNNKINFDLRRGFISWELHEQYCRKCKPQKGDIFVVKSGATTGNVAYVDVDFEFSIWSPLALVRCDEHIAFYKFIYYVLLTDVFKKQVELSWSFGTQQNIGMRVIERIKVPVPPVVEQRDIAAFLDNETLKIAEIQSNIESQISTLIAYRKSLIHECVTGQRRVTEVDVERAKTIVHNH